MKSKKLIGLFLCIAVVFGIALSGTFAASADDTNPDSGVTAGSEEQNNEAGEKEAVVEEKDEKDKIDKADENLESENSNDNTDVNTNVENMTENEVNENSEEDDQKTTLYDRLMACTTIEEAENIIDNATDEELNSLTDEEKSAIEEHINSLIPYPADNGEDEGSNALDSEIEIVSFTNVAPFGDPVIGGTN